MQKEEVLKQEAAGGKNLIVRTDIMIGCGIVTCLILCYFVPQIQCLAACTAVIMCMQEAVDLSFKSSLTRLLGVICGGGLGVGIVVLDNLLQLDVLFFLMAGAGAVLTLYLGRLMKIPAIAGRVSCVTFVLVILVADGAGRIAYAGNRLFGTLAGTVLAILVSAVWKLCCSSGKKNSFMVH